MFPSSKSFLVDYLHLLVPFLCFPPPEWRVGEEEKMVSGIMSVATHATALLQYCDSDLVVLRVVTK